MDFLDFIRKVHKEKRERERQFILKGGKGSGWFAPPKGTHGKGKGRAKLLDFSKMSKEERKKTIRNLKATDTFRLYHGTNQLDTARRIVQEGFDPTKKPERGRIYHGTLAPEKGFFVSPHRSVSEGFGAYVIEFETQARDLLGPPRGGIPKGQTPDEFWERIFPNSFRPSLSAGLDLMESQGLLVEKVPSKRVRAVWRWRYTDPERRSGEWYATKPDDFLKEGE